MYCFFFSSRRRHTRLQGDWSSDVCSSDLVLREAAVEVHAEDPLPSADVELPAAALVALAAHDMRLGGDEVAHADRLGAVLADAADLPADLHDLAAGLVPDGAPPACSGGPA